MIDVDDRDIKALEDENSRLQEVLQEVLEDPTDNPSIRFRDLERINHQLTALMILARKLHEQNAIAVNHTDNLSVNYRLRHPSTL